MQGQNEALNLEVNPRSSSDSTKSSANRRSHLEDVLGPSKRFCEEVRSGNVISSELSNSAVQNYLMNANFPSTHMKISSKGLISLMMTSLYDHFFSDLDGRQLEGQLTVSMEINGILYHGILFAQTNRNKMS